MTAFKSFIAAFSMYSKIPMPKMEWSERSMKYAICFFPLIGGVIGVLLFSLTYLTQSLQFNKIIFAALATYIPVLITGGIHLDGFCDTIDAISSNQSRERKLEILKDSNSGAFAIIKCGIYYLLYFAAFTQISVKGVMVICISYILSRALSGLGVVNFKSAKKDGLAVAFKQASHQKPATAVLLITAATAIILMAKTDVFLGLAASFTALVVFAYYKYFAYKEFGGVTGDLAGYFLQLCEIYMLYSVVIAEGVQLLWN